MRGNIWKSLSRVVLKGDFKMTTKTSKELRAIAKSLGIKGYWDMKKDQLIEAIEAIEAHQEQPETTEEVVDVETHEEETVVPETEPEDETTPSDKKKQGRKSKNLFTYNGKTQSIADWSKETGIGTTTLYNRLVYKGWAPEKAFTHAPKKKAQ